MNTSTPLESPLVSIIVPNYNHAPFLQQRIESILNQSFQNFELILLDDCSTDNSLNVLNSYKNHPKVSYVEWNTINSGSTFKQWAKGIENAKGTYIWIAESDDFAEINFLEKVMSRFVSNPKIDIVFTRIVNVLDDGSLMQFISKTDRKKGELLSSDFTIKGKFLLHEFIPDTSIVRNVSCAVFKKKVLTKKVRKFTQYRTIGDLYFWTTLCIQNRTFSFLNEPLSFMRNHHNTVRNNPAKNQFKETELIQVHKNIVLGRPFNRKTIYSLLKYYYRKLKK